MSGCPCVSPCSGCWGITGGILVAAGWSWGNFTLKDPGGCLAGF